LDWLKIEEAPFQLLSQQNLIRTQRMYSFNLQPSLHLKDSSSSSLPSTPIPFLPFPK
jgi:hypothetical protein